MVNTVYFEIIYRRCKFVVFLLYYCKIRIRISVKAYGKSNITSKHIISRARRTLIITETITESVKPENHRIIFCNCRYGSYNIVRKNCFYICNRIVITYTATHNRIGRVFKWQKNRFFYTCIKNCLVNQFLIIC